MSQKTEPLYIRKSTTQSFLLSKSPEPVPAASEPDDIIGRDVLTNAYPRILIGDCFMDEALIRIETALRFGALWLRIDDFDAFVEENSERETVVHLALAAKAIETTCLEYNGIWGLVERDLFACLFPDGDDESCRRFADRIRESYRHFCGGSLTAGITRYPLAVFTREQTLENARKAIDHAAFFSPGGTAVFDAVSLNISGDGFYHRGQVDEAIEEYRKALILDPSNMNVHNSLGVCYAVLGAYQSAIEEFASAMGQAPEDAMPVYNTGVVHMMTGALNTALTFLENAARMAPDMFEIAFQLGRLHLDADRPKRAIDYFRKALGLNPDSGIPHRYIGECCERLALNEEAISHYKKAIRANPNDAAALAALGHLFCLSGENAEIALMFCRHSVEISPKSGALRQKLGEILLKTGKLDEALAEFEEASALGFDCNALIQETLDLRSPHDEKYHFKHTG